MGYMREDRLASAGGERTGRYPGCEVDRRERRCRSRAWEGTRDVCDTEESGGKRERKEDAWGFNIGPKLTQERRSKHERGTRSGDRDILDPTQFPVQSKSSQERKSAKPSQVYASIPIPPTCFRRSGSILVHLFLYLSSSPNRIHIVLQRLHQFPVTQRVIIDSDSFHILNYIDHPSAFRLAAAR